MMAAALAAGAAGAAGTFAGSIIGSKSREDDDAGPSRSLEKQSTDGSFDKLDDLMDAPPVPGPKPASPKPEHMPGGYADDIEFAATLAAGLKHTGFDANIVIDDPTYHRRDSPPGSNELNGKHYYAPTVDSISDLSLQEKHRGPEPGFVLGEVETPKDESLPFQDAEDSSSKKLSKKEKKRLAKLAKESSDVVDAPHVSYEPESQSRAIYETPEQVEPEPKLSKKEKRRREKAAREAILDGQDSDGQIYAEPEPLVHSEASWENWEDTSDLKSRISRTRGIDSSEHSLVSAPIGSSSEVKPSRAIHSDDEWESTKKSKKKSKRSSGYDSPSRDLPVRSATAKVGVEDSGKKSRKSKRRSGTDDDFYRYDDERPSRTRDLFEDRDVSSIVSEPRTEDRQRKSRSSKPDYRYDDDDTKSVASAPGSSRKSRESEKTKEPDRRSSGIFSSIFKSSKDGEKQKKDSFLGNAGTFGAGVGILGIGAAALTPFNANNAFSEKKTDHEDISEWSRNVENYDPDIVARAIKPAIDPQYGDFLPLPPSEPGTPVGTPEELPTLPDSRPDTPPEERGFKRERPFHNRRRSAQETPSKIPSNTAIPIQLRMGGRSGPSSPALFKASPMSSPVVGMAESPTRSSPTVVRRPTSWDSSREFKPLYLVEHSRQISIDAPILEADLPALPPSESSSRGSPPESEGWESAHEYAQAMNDRGFDYGHYGDNSGLRLDTSLPLMQPSQHETGSQESTPKAETRPEFPDMSSLPRALDQGEPSTLAGSTEEYQPEPEPVESTSRDRSSYLLQSAPSSVKSVRSFRGDFDDYRLPEVPASPTRTYGAEEITTAVDYKDELASVGDHFSDAHEISSVRSVELISDAVKGKGKSVGFFEPGVAEDVPTSRDALAIEQAPAAEDASVIEKTVSPEEISSIEKAPAAEDVSVIEATPVVEEVSSAEKAPAAEDVPVIGITPVVEEVSSSEKGPATEDVSVIETIPIIEEVSSAERTPATRDISAIETTPIVEEISSAEKTPATEEISSLEKTPVVEEVLSAEKAPTIEDVSVIESTPTVEEAPAVGKVLITREMSSIEKNPITEETSVEKAPLIEETPITKEVPGTGEEEPTAEELSKMSAKDRKKAKRAVKKRAEALALGATEDVSAAEKAPVTEVVPVIERTPAIEEVPAVEKAPATEDVSAAENAPAIEEITSIEEAPVAEEVSSVEKAPLTEETPITKEVPGEEEPTADELSKMSAKDRKKAKRAAKKRAEALALGLAAGVAVGVAANTSKSTESETPAPREEETSALEQAPANDKAITTEEIPPVENAPTADVASTTEKALIADEAPTAENPPPPTRPSDRKCPY
uniref:Involucrin repeat protein n=1 Tax=Bionectria ochroleuca TaxID=29856 RepID=A0A8H7N975_BIOOC